MSVARKFSGTSIFHFPFCCQKSLYVLQLLFSIFRLRWKFVKNLKFLKNGNGKLEIRQQFLNSNKWTWKHEKLCVRNFTFKKVENGNWNGGTFQNIFWQSCVKIFTSYAIWFFCRKKSSIFTSDATWLCCRKILKISTSDATSLCCRKILLLFFTSDAT